MSDAVIVATARTPLCKSWRGAFNMTHGASLGAHVVRAALTRARLEPAEAEDIVFGCAYPEGATGLNIARQIALRAELPVTTAGMTVNRFCSSGLQAIAIAAQRVLVDRVPVVIAGGVESISCVQNELNQHMLREAWLKEHKPEIYLPMLATAEVVAKRYAIGRGRQDEYGVRSQLRAAAAQEAGRFAAEIAPITVTAGIADKDRPAFHAPGYGGARRGHPPGHDPRGCSEDQARGPRRLGSRRQRQPVLRRRRGLRGDGLTARRAARPGAARRIPRSRGGRLRAR